MRDLLPEAPRRRSDPDAKAAARHRLWHDGLALLRAITGKPERGARALMGKLLAASQDDPVRVLRVLRDGHNEILDDPVPWLLEGCKPPGERIAQARARRRQDSTQREVVANNAARRVVVLQRMRAVAQKPDPDGWAVVWFHQVKLGQVTARQFAAACGTLQKGGLYRTGNGFSFGMVRIA